MKRMMIINIFTINSNIIIVIIIITVNSIIFIIVSILAGERELPGGGLLCGRHSVTHA